MFLKRITLSGFKSFADRTEFDFQSGITAVVGPNGCGKSNVLDAVRWVLGEQSARSLRGGKMSDVIFAGSRSRKPAHYAEVQLVLDNRTGVLRNDQDEVVVARVLYRSGDSEYRLNGNVCRLKDVRELLLDTGVGVDAYSVIEQGRVDMLLQASPVERREIFEEAAGISRYKVRRIEAQRKLERTQNNLLRLHDIIEELERRLRSVRLAAGKARNYQQYDARLRELRSAFSMAEYHELEQSRRVIAEEVAALDEELRAQRARLAQQDAELAELEHARQALDDDIQAADEQLRQLQASLSTLEERAAQIEKRLPELAESRDRRRAQAREAAQRLAEQQERLLADQAAHAELAVALEHAAERIASVEAEQAQAAAQAQAGRQTLEREKVAAYEAARRSALLQNERENHVQQQARVRAQIDRLSGQHTELTAQRDAHARQLADVNTQLANLDQQVRVEAETLRGVDADINRFNDEAERLDADIGSAKESRTSLKSRLALLDDMERRLEGVERGTQTVLGWRAEDPVRGLVAGLVADLLRIDDPRLALLQPVLSTFEGHLVVQDTPAFLDELERRGGAGGALHVVALDRLGGTPTPISYKHAPGYVARAMDWVTCAEEHGVLAEHLLGRVFIVETLAHALRLATDALSGCVFVTLTGQTVAANGRLAFDVTTAAAGLISRKAEIRQLQGEVDEVEARLVRLTRRRMEVDEGQSDAQLRREGVLQRIATLQREHAEARGQAGHLSDARQRVERELGGLDEELRGAADALEKLGARLEALSSESAAVDETQRGHQTRIAILADELAAQERAAARLGQEQTEARVAHGRVAEKLAAVEAALRELQARQAALAQQREAAEREADEAVRQIDVAQQELAATRARQIEERAVCEQRSAEVLGLRERRQQLRQRVEESGATARAMQHRVEEVEGAWHGRQVALRECEVRSEALASRVRDELGLELAALYASYQHAEQDWEAIKAEIEELRGKIARLGHVNLDALAELEELTPRCEHLVGQRDDLTDARQRLETLIAELDRESRTRFAESFEQIRANFQEMFRKLFGGGKADILLEDPENPLECGIDIIARPPGKEPQSITLLSGGEKTLTAVALLMGVFKSRPSPFAILDEVDAALDESNIERFNSVLHEFLAHTQFVVITHSKRTMASADTLYGVTMEEPGVSKRVGVRFDDRVQAPHVA